jgi:hypothetical protein
MPWVAAPGSEKAARFASAEAVRWLEEAITSYQSFMLGLTLILLAGLIIWSAKVHRPVGYLLGLSGVANLVVGWILGLEGFAPEGAIPSYLGQICLLVSGAWLLIAALRTPGPSEVALGPSIPGTA